MKKRIIINSTLSEVRVAITENDRLAEFYIELPDKERYIGNIYLGRVSRIVQGINAAFINLGLNQDGFLHFSDVDESLELSSIITDEEDEEEGIDDLDFFNDDEKITTAIEDSDELNTSIALRKTSTQNTNKKSPTFHTKRSGEVKINIEPKQDVIVQVVREAYSHKGVKVTTKIALPGRHVVLVPFDNLLGVSKKIKSFQERKRLRSLAKRVLPEGFGCIIRTAAQNQTEEELRRDWVSLLEVWKEIETKVQKSKSPTLLYQDMQLAASVIRDLFTTDIDSVIIDSKKLFKEIVAYLKKNSPHLVEKVQLYNEDRPIFDAYGLEDEIEDTYKRKINLHSGGSIIIEQTEAMTVIDVNSGKGTEKDQEKNAYKTNLEALKDIARQIRLRDIGGMVIIDFIDMSQEKNRKKVFAEMKNELSKDRGKTVVYPFTQLGLIQITRQRINQNIVEKTSEVCPICNGTGRITSKVMLLNTIERWLRNFRRHSREFRLILQIHPNVAAYLTEGTISRLSRLMIKYFVKIKVQQNPNISLEEFKVVSVKEQKDITKKYS
jgi:ribonuclease G